MARHLMRLLAVLSIALALVAFVPPARAETPPGIEIVAPINGETVSGVYEVTGVAADDLGITFAEVRIDLGEWRNATDTSGNGSWASWSFSWDTRLYANGWHEVWARAWDVEGNHGFDRAEVRVSNEIHENTPPWVAIHFPRQESTVCGEVLVEGHAGDDDANDSVEQVQVRFREGEWQDARPDGGSFSTWFFALDTRLYENGWGRLDARSFDGEAYSDIYDVWIRILNPCEGANHRPWVHIDEPDHGETVSGIVVISGRAGDPDGLDKVELVQVRIGARGEFRNATPLGPGEDPWRSWATEWDTRERDNGWVAVCSRSWDGELYSELHCVEVFVQNGEHHENHAPIVRIHFPRQGEGVSGFVRILGGAEDPDEPTDKVEMVFVRIDGGDWVRAEDISGDGSFHRWARGWNTREWDNGEHRVCARSWDGELYSEPHCITVFVRNDHEEENHAPRVDITHPADGTTVNGTVTISGTAEDDHGVRYVEWRIGGDGMWRDAFDTSGDGSWSTWKATWHTFEFDDGCYTIYARAFDGSRYSELDHIRLCVDNVRGEDHRPDVVIRGPECGTVVSGTVTVHGVAEDDHEVVSVDVRIDGGEWHEARLEGSGTRVEWSFEWDTTRHDNGEHHVYARARDNAGQYSEVARCGYLVHNPPEGGSPPDGPDVTGMGAAVSSMGLLGFLGAVLVRRTWLGSVL